jgi:putative SOS response-associated peptidase YedK
MCFSVNVNLVKEELENRFGATFLDPDKYSPSYYYHAFGLPELPAICSDATNKIKMLRWGLIPYWTRSRTDADEIRFKTFNARSDSISVKPSFSQSFACKRCLIPVRGFFEWQHTGNQKIPWYITLKSGDIMSLAGLWDEWVDSSTGEIFSTFTVVTTDANDLMASIHNTKKRMPVIIGSNEEKKWLDISCSPDEVLKMANPYSSDILRAHTISPLINSKTAGKNTPDLIKEYKWEVNGSLF